MFAASTLSAIYLYRPKKKKEKKMRDTMHFLHPLFPCAFETRSHFKDIKLSSARSTVYEKTDYFVFEGKRCPIEANNPALVLEVLRAEIFLRPNSAPGF